MTGTELAALIRYNTKTNSTTFTNTDMLPLVNVYIKEIAAKIVELNLGYFLIPATFSLVANQREYGFPDEMLSRMQKLEIKFSSSDSRFPAQFIKDYRGSETESEIVKSYSNEPDGFAYTIRRRAVLILSGTISAVTSGGRLWYHQYPAALANLTGSTELDIDPTTTTFGFPRQFHLDLANLVSRHYKDNKPRRIPLSDAEKNVDVNIRIHLSEISKIDNAAEYIGEGLPATETGHDGWDY